MCGIAKASRSKRKRKQRPADGCSRFDLPPIKNRHLRIVKAGVQLRLRAVLVSQDRGIGLKLRSEEGAEIRQSGGWVEVVGVGSLVVDDPPRAVTLRQRLESGAEEAIDADVAQTALDN